MTNYSFNTSLANHWSTYEILQTQKWNQMDKEFTREYYANIRFYLLYEYE